MIKANIEEFLHNTFQLPIVVDLSQTKVERVVSYRIREAFTNVHKDGRITGDVDVVCTLRAENGYDSLGWLHVKLASATNSKGVKLDFVSPVESVEYVNTNEVLFSVTMQLKCDYPIDVMKEKIKQIDMR